MTARTQRSFETLYHEHVSDVYRYALAVTGQTSDAEDVTQTTFMNAYRAYARGERPRKPQNWLLKIAHNVCRQRARFAYYRVREVELEEDVVEALVPPDDVPSASDIRRALSFLPFQQRAVLIMRELEGRTHAEIAEVMGLTTQATEMLAFRGRRALREHLAGSLTCTQAASALDRQQDGTLDAESAGLLRAHLRECADCQQLARRMRAQQSAWKTLAVVPLPTSLHTFGGSGAVAGGGAAVGGAGLGAGAAIKLAAATVAAVTVGGTAYVVKEQVPSLHHRHATPPAQHVGTGNATPRPAPPRRPVAPRHSAPAEPVVTTPAALPPPTMTAPSAPSAPVVHPLHPVKPAHPAHPAKPVHPAHPQPTNRGVRTRAHGTPTQSQANETSHGQGSEHILQNAGRGQG